MYYHNYVSPVVSPNYTQPKTQTISHSLSLSGRLLTQSLSKRLYHVEWNGDSSGEAEVEVGGRVGVE